MSELFFLGISNLKLYSFKLAGTHYFVCIVIQSEGFETKPPDTGGVMWISGVVGEHAAETALCAVTTLVQRTPP